MTDKEVGLNDIIDLSVVELFILNYLVKIAASTVRFSAFNDINAQLSQSKISRSSFYNSLEKLENKGLVEVKENPHGSGNVVSATSLAKSAIDQVNIFSIWGSVSPDSNIKRIIKEQGYTLIGRLVSNQLLISFDQFLHIPILESLADYTKRQTFLADDDYFNKISQQTSLDLEISRLEGGIIKEPDNYFDRVILYRFQENALVMGHSSHRILEESFRIVKPDADIIIIGLAELPRTNNFILESMVSDVLENHLPSKIDKGIEEQFSGFDCEIQMNEVFRGIRFIKIRKLKP